jgi:hypothetical protein
VQVCTVYGSNLAVISKQCSLRHPEVYSTSTDDRYLTNAMLDGALLGVLPVPCNAAVLLGVLSVCRDVARG